MKTILKTLDYTAKAHQNQKRKYTNEPYINHPIAVANLISQVTTNKDMISAALLHDVVEDTLVNLNGIRWHFGTIIHDLVYWLTDISRPKDGNRATRKQIDRRHIAKAPPEAKTIKLADLIDNTRTIVKYDPEFAKVYMEEKRLLLEVLEEGDQFLFKWAEKLVFDYFGR